MLERFNKWIKGKDQQSGQETGSAPSQPEDAHEPVEASADYVFDDTGELYGSDIVTGLMTSGEIPFGSYRAERSDDGKIHIWKLD